MGQTNYGHIDERRKDAGGARNSKWLSSVCPKQDMANGHQSGISVFGSGSIRLRLCSGVSQVLISNNTNSARWSESVVQPRDGPGHGHGHGVDRICAQCQCPG